MQAVVREAGLSRAVEERAAPLADADDDVDRLRHASPRFGVVLELALAELQHVADDGDAAAARVGLLEQRQRARERVRIRVVGVVVDRGAVDVHDHAAVMGRLQLFHATADAIPGDADGARRGDRGEEVLDVVPPRQRQLHREASHREGRAEKAALAEVLGAEHRVVVDAVRDLRPREALADAHVAVAPRSRPRRGTAPAARGRFGFRRGSSSAPRAAAAVGRAPSRQHPCRRGPTRAAPHSPAPPVIGPLPKAPRRRTRSTPALAWEAAVAVHRETRSRRRRVPPSRHRADSR